MSFDAGEIVAYLKLDKTAFDAELEEARAQADDPIEVKVKPELDETAMDEVLAEEEPLRRDIRPEVKPTYIEGEAEAVGRNLANDILSGASARDASGGGGGIGRLISAMLGEGLTQAELTSGLKNLGFTGAEIKDALGASILGEIGTGGAGDSVIARDIVKSILPAPELVANAMGEEIDQWYRQLGPAPGIRDTGGANGGGLMGKLIAGMIGKGATEADIANGLKNLGFTSDEVSQAILGTLTGGINDLERNGGGVSVRNDIRAMFSKVLGGAGGLFDSLTLGNGGLISAIFNPLGAAAGAAFVSAFGLALGGAVAGTSIGLAGTLFAVIPGLLDLMKGIQAHTAETTKGASLAGFTPAQLALGKSLGNLLGAGSKGLGAAETEVMPQITKFINAVTKAIPLINEFAQPAIKAMSGFFDAIDKGMGSGGFKAFVNTMSKDVGPIMDDFGQVILNLGGAVGGFLSAFGGSAADSVGGWFVRITGDLDKFLNHVHISKSSIGEMKDVFKSLGDVLGTVWTALGKLWKALEPIGEFFFKVVGPVANFVNSLIKLVPSGLLTTILGVALALKGFALAMGLVDAAMDANPIGAIIIAIGILVFAIYELVKHWKTVWGAIKTVALDAWHFLDNDIIHPIVSFFTKTWNSALSGVVSIWRTTWNGIKSVVVGVWDFIDRDVFQPINNFIVNVFKDSLNVFKKIWDDVWGGIKATVEFVWKILKPIFETMTAAIKLIVGGLKDLKNFFTGPGGSLQGSGIGGGGVPGISAGPYGGGVAGSGLPSLTSKSTLGGGGIPGLTIYVDARGHHDSVSVGKAARTAIYSALPSLQAALARGAA